MITVIVDVIYLDFQKAFDTVPHQRLLNKLTSFGIHGNVLKWIEKFLNNREQQVVLNSHKSSTITSGVPQGSVLGPPYYSQCSTINCIKPSADVCWWYKNFLFIRNKEDYIGLQRDLNLLQWWSAQWQLKFNISKCKHLHFGPAHHNGTSLNGIPIDIITTHSDLTLLLMTNLNSMIVPLKLSLKLTEYLDWLKSLLNTLTLPCLLVCSLH